jgi:hypothetical protein
MRGATTVELALLLPLFALLLFWGLFFTELLHAKLALLEASRFAAWEMTSHALTDFGSGDHPRAFATAREAVAADAQTRYADLDSIDQRVPGGFAVDTGAFNLDVSEETVAMVDVPLPSSGAGGGFAGRAAAAANGGLFKVLGAWGFDRGGQVCATASVRIHPRFLPLQWQQLERSYHLVASGWDLKDGGDAVMRDHRAGAHTSGDLPTGLYQQVDRMKFLGLAHALDDVPGVGGALGFFHDLGLPAFAGTFVVAHNYAGREPDRGCFANPLQTPNPSPGGLNNVARGALLDWSLPRCFDTAPFRDVNSYADSRYVQLFRARGPHFMGCPNAQADDPTAVRLANPGDQSQDRIPCAR